MDWFDLGKSILSASLTAGAVTFLGNQWAQTRQVRLAHLRDQLEKFYGPVVFLIRTNETIFQHHQKLNQYSDENLGPTARINWQDEEQVKRNTAETDLEMVFKNKYADKIKNHNMQMVDVIRGNYHLIDAEDQAACQNLVLNVVRLEVENDQTSRLREFKRANPILIVDPVFVDAIQATYQRKQRELIELSTSHWSDARKTRLKHLDAQKPLALTGGLKTKG